MADAGASGTEMQKSLVFGDDYPIGVLSRCPQDRDNHSGCSSCRGDGTVLPSSPKTDVRYGKVANRLARRAVSIL